MRIRKEDLHTIFESWAKIVGGRIASSYKDVGGYNLDYSNGGVKVEYIMNDSGGVSDISPRMGKTELYHWLKAGIIAILEYNANNQEE